MRVSKFYVVIFVTVFLSSCAVMKKFGFSRKVSTADIKKEVQKKELSPLKETATSKTVPELENKPSPANEAIPPHSARDLVAAMEYFEKYHSSFDGTQRHVFPLPQNLSTNPLTFSIPNRKYIGRTNIRNNIKPSRATYRDIKAK